MTSLQRQAVLVCVVCALAALLTVGIPLTLLKRGTPDTPGTQLPPPELPQPEKPGVPMTDGTPMACRQKNAAAFLAEDVQTSVMAHYAPGLFSTKQKLHSRHPAPDEDTAAVF